MIALSMQFHYSHPLGERGPYFAGLQGARVMASRCPACARAWFPPQRCCGAGFHWEQLAGTGTVVVATDGFALIAMDGADNLALGVLREPARVGDRVRMAPAPEPAGHPAQAVFFQVETGNCIASE